MKLKDIQLNHQILSIFYIKNGEHHRDGIYWNESKLITKKDKDCGIDILGNKYFYGIKLDNNKHNKLKELKIID